MMKVFVNKSFMQLGDICIAEEAPRWKYGVRYCRLHNYDHKHTLRI